MENSKQGVLKRLKSYLRPLLFLGVILIISLFFPTDLKFKYEYERQQSWQYEDLKAPFDFPIKKSKGEIKLERDELLASATPVYEIDLKIVDERKAAFIQSCQSQLEQDGIDIQFKDVPIHPDRYIDYGLKYLDRVFKRGIIRLAETTSIIY